MNKSVRILGNKAIPVVLLVISLVACGAGAAAGTVLAGKVTGEMPVAVSQALLVEAPKWADSVTTDTNEPQQVYRHVSWIHKPNRSVGVAADDNTAFQAAAEMAVGDWAAFCLPVKNASENDLVAELTFNVPSCLEVEVFAKTTATGIEGVVRTGLNTWKVLVDKDAEYRDGTDCLMVVISVDDNCAPGYFDISGTFKQISY